MTAPRLNRALVLERPARVPDGAGGFSEAWEALGSLWAEVTAYRVVVRAAPEGSSMRPAAGQRFRDGARVYAIRAVAERDPGGRFLICFCDEEVAA